jgi:antirestriction protein ArdC
MNPSNTQNWQALLVDAVNVPGKISRAYSLFHNYSMGNALETLWQCSARGIEPGPINTFVGWKELGRHVRKGEKAIWLWMPITKTSKERDTSTGEETEFRYVRFVYVPRWFVLSQTDGEPLTDTPSAPGFDLEAALVTLNISRVPFGLTDGNCQGFARERSIAVNPIAELALKTSFHEMAHVLLGHTAEKAMADGEHTPRNLGEVEAESVALICCESLGLPGPEYSRGYIQHWLRGGEIPEKSAQKIFSVASQILRAGQVGQSGEDLVAA